MRSSPISGSIRLAVSRRRRGRAPGMNAFVAETQPHQRNEHGTGQRQELDHARFAHARIGKSLQVDYSQPDQDQHSGQTGAERQQQGQCQPKTLGGNGETEHKDRIPTRDDASADAQNHQAKPADAGLIWTGR